MHRVSNGLSTTPAGTNRSPVACFMACLRSYVQGIGSKPSCRSRHARHSFRSHVLLQSRRRLSGRNSSPRSSTQAVHRGYLGETRPHKHSRYSHAIIDQDKEDHRQNMRTVGGWKVKACTACSVSCPCPTFQQPDRFLILSVGHPTEVPGDTFNI